MSYTLSLSEQNVRTFAKNGAQVILGSFFIALLAQGKIPLPFTPVPITLQTLAVMLVGGFLGSTKGSLSVSFYLLMVSLGLPFLAGGGVNPLALIGPTGGYLFGMLVQTAITGKIFERKFNYISTLLLLAATSLLQLTMGAVWLGAFTGWENVIAMGILPFLAGEGFKIFLATNITSCFRKES